MITGAVIMAIGSVIIGAAESNLPLVIIGLGSAICTWIIAIGGYVGTAEVQTEAALASIRFRYGYFGAILSLVVFALCIIMNIDKNIGQIQRDLEAKKSAV